MILTWIWRDTDVKIKEYELLQGVNFSLSTRIARSIANYTDNETIEAGSVEEISIGDLARSEILQVSSI